MSAEVIAINRSNKDANLVDVLENIKADFEAGRMQSLAIIWRRTAKTDEEAVISDIYVENYWLARSLHELVGLLENFKLEIINSRSISA